MRFFSRAFAHETPAVPGALLDMLRLADDCGAFPGVRKAVLLGSAFSSIASPALAQMTKDNERLDGIPTMVTQRELRLLANLFASVPVAGDILEIGCYLGGSTAAIASGLDAAGAPNRLYVLDSFAWSDPDFVADLGRDVEALQVRYPLSPIALEATRRGDWHLAFNEVHRTRPYYRRLCVRKALIPYASADVFDMPRYVPPGTKLGAVFIDGFKSWESTYSAMKALIPYVVDGALLIFQDFSWYDCYWLPVLATRLGLELVMKVDNTAVFMMRSPDVISANLEVFGPAADPKSYPFYRDVLSDYARLMYHSGDDVGFLLHTAQSYVLAFSFEKTEDAAIDIEFLRQACERLNVGWLMTDLLSKSTFRFHA